MSWAAATLGGEDANHWDDARVAAMLRLLDQNMVQSFAPPTTQVPKAKGILAQGDFAAMPGVMNGGDWLRSMLASGRVVVSDVRTYGVLDMTDPSDWVGSAFFAYDLSNPSEKALFDAVLAGDDSDLVGARVLAEPASAAGSSASTSSSTSTTAGEDAKPASSLRWWLGGAIVAVASVTVASILLSRSKDRS